MTYLEVATMKELWHLAGVAQTFRLLAEGAQVAGDIQAEYVEHVNNLVEY
jgi:hypothetical protein